MAACRAEPGAVEDYPFDGEVLELVHHSYDLVVARLTRAQRASGVGVHVVRR